MHRKFVRRGSSILSFAMISALAITLAACGSSSHTSSGTTPTSTVLVNLGDAPSDRITAFAMTINSMTLNGPNGTTTLMSTPTVVEMTRLIGAQQPLALLGVPQGTYTSATINVGSAVVTFMNPTLTQKTVTVGSTTIPFSSPMTVAATPVVFNFDLDMTHSVNIDASGNVTMTPTFTASMGASGTGISQDPENGAMHFVGSVSGTPGSNSFGMSMLQSGQVMNFTSNGSTTFSNTSMGMMGNGQILSVDAIMQSDGTMLAQQVRFLAGSGGSMANGMMNTVTGSPATSFTMMAQNGTGAGVMSSMMGNGISVNTSGATYAVDTNGVDMTGLSFTFDGTTLSPAQRVEAISNGPMSGGSGMMGGMMNAGSMSTSGGMIRLVQQGMSGTVTSAPSGSPVRFTMTVPSDSAFAVLTGITTMTVYQPAGAELRGLSSVTNGAQVRVRGLMFHNSGTYQMVATRIMTP